MNYLRPIFLAVILFTASSLVFADKSFSASTPEDDGPAQEVNLEKGVAALDNADWSEAIHHLKKAVKADSKNADAHNYLAYAYRRSGQLDPAFEHYGKALSLNPKHRGANEYIGQAYLLIGNLDKAQEHLTALKKICGSVCRETSTLKKAIASYKEGNDKQSLLENDSNW